MAACSNCTLEPTAVVTDPSFVAVATDDYRPATGSPLIDAGVDTCEDRNGDRETP